MTYPMLKLHNSFHGTTALIRAAREPESWEGPGDLLMDLQIRAASGDRLVARRLRAAERRMCRSKPECKCEYVAV